jgi:PAS domain S-box-containing protein
MAAGFQVNMRLRQFGPVALVLVLTAVGFFVTRAHGESDARREATHRADLAATRVRDRVVQAEALMDGVRRFLVVHASPGVAPEQFGDIGDRWLGPVGLPAAAWVERVPATDRAGYEARPGRHDIVVPTPKGRFVGAPARRMYLPATLVTGSPPMSVPGIDVGSFPGVATAAARRQTAYQVTATPMIRLGDGTLGLFLVQSAQRLSQGVVEPGYVVIFLPARWLLAGAADPAAANQGVQIVVGGKKAGDAGNGEMAQSAFNAGGQPFVVRVPRGAVQGAAAVQPWLVGGAGLGLAALAGALGVFAARRARTKAELDRLFTITPDLVVVAGFDGYFKRVNPAFEAVLGYTDDEALTRPYAELIHPDDRERTAAEGMKLRNSGVNDPIENRYLCKDGSYRWIEWTATPVPAEQVSYAVGRDVTERRQTEAELREAEERNRTLAEQQAALRRVATLVAHSTPSQELFAAVTEEVGQLLPVGSSAMGRYESDGTFTTVAAWSRTFVAFPVGRRWPPEGRNITTMVFETGRPARMDDFSDASGPVGLAAREAGYRSAVGTPIVVEGRLWGVITAASSAEQPLPADTESRLASFTELVATAIANAESRSGLAELAQQQAALRHVATLVAEAVPPTEVLAAVGREVIGLFDAQAAAITRVETDGALTVVSNSGTITSPFTVGTRLMPEPGWVLNAVIETGRSARRDDYADASDPVPRMIRDLGIRSMVAAPIVVEGAPWGVLIIATERERFPEGTEQRLEEFTALAATAIANAESRAEVAASRVRIVAASDETRRRIERDLHDGTQQRLVSLSLQLRLAESTVPAELEEARATIGGVAGELNRVIDELREISRGIHPAILSEGGLGPALRTLARRSAIPVELGSVIDHRLPEPVEVAAYYVVSEALTNAVKHADASRVNVDADVRDGSLRLSIRDDGVGGADPAEGSGLIGLRDRVEALGGSVEIESPAGRGTCVTVELPVEPGVMPPETAEPLQARATHAPAT